MNEEFKEFYGTKATNKTYTISPDTKNATGIRVVTSPHLKQFKKQTQSDKLIEENNNINNQAVGFDTDDQGWLSRRSKSNLNEMQM